MSTIERPHATTHEPHAWNDPLAEDPRFDHWNEWPVFWSAIWVGALASVVGLILCGLLGIAFGAHQVGAEHRVVSLRDVGFWSIFCGVLSAFCSGMLGGWITGEIAGIRRGETGLYHGAISWMVATPLVIVLTALGAGSYLGGWYGGFAVNSSHSGQADTPIVRPDPPLANASQTDIDNYFIQEKAYREQVRKWREDTSYATRNAAIMGASALLIGLIGSVIGGWLASGEPMSYTLERLQHAPAKTR